eukprot:scpid105169/ scgid35720/ 
MLNRSFGPGPLSRSSTKDKSDVYHTTQSDMNSSNTSSGRRTLQRSQSGCTEETLGSTPAIAPVAIEWSHIYHMTIQGSHVGSNSSQFLYPWVTSAMSAACWFVWSHAMYTFYTNELTRMYNHSGVISLYYYSMFLRALGFTGC